MNGDRLTNGLINRVLNIKFLECVVRRIEHGQNTDDTIMVDFVVAQVQGQQFVVGEQQFSHHHGASSFDFVHVEVETLHIGTVLERLGQVLSTLTLDSVSLQIQVEKSD